MKTFAFLDESGNTSLNLEHEGTSSHYVVAAIVVPEDALDTARTAAAAIRQRHFGQGEMKSSGVANDDARRIRILNDLEALPISYFVFIADKSVIWRDSGLIYKRPFIKFLSGKVYNKLFKTFPLLELYADQHGTEEFMREVERYVFANHVPELFAELGSTVAFVDSKDEILVQVADIVAGSVRRVFDQKRKSPDPAAILKALRPRLTSLEEWPPIYRTLDESAETTVRSDFDSLVRHYCVATVRHYMSELDEDDEDTPIRSATLNFLLQRALFEDENDYITGGAIVAAMAQNGHPAFNINALRSKVIAHYRDNGVIIGSDQNGYKIPTAVKDIMDYVHRCDAVAPPLVRRLKGARDQIRLMSHNELDILKDESFAVLRSLVESFENNHTR